MKIRSVLTALTATAMAVSVSIVSVPVAHADLTTPGSFNTVHPLRVLDTRYGIGTTKAVLAAHGTLTFQPTPGLTTPVTAVALTVTAVNPKTLGYLTVYGAGRPLPLASNLNFQIGENVPNMVITPVGTGGRVSIYNGSLGTIDVLADISGFYTGGTNTAVSGSLVPMAPRRFLDTRIGLGAPKRPAGPNSLTVLKVAGVNGVPVDASSVVMNVTAEGATARGYVTAYAGSPKPATSTVNYLPHKTRANLALVPIGPDGTISLYNGTLGTTALIADISGYFVGGSPATDGTFVPTTPYRAFDSRGAGGRPAGALTISKIGLFTSDPVFSAFKAVVVNVTAAEPQTYGFLTTWDGTTQLPSVSSNNFQANQDSAGAVIVPVNPDGTISIYNGSYGNVNYVVDITGFVFNLPAATPFAGTTAKTSVSAAARLADALAKVKQLSRTTSSVAVSVTTTR